MKMIFFQMILCIYFIYINYILLNIIHIINTKLSYYDKLLDESNMKIKRIAGILHNMHKKNIELTDIKLEELEENLINKFKSS